MRGVTVAVIALTCVAAQAAPAADPAEAGIRTAMLALIDQDRAELLAEAEGAQNSRRGV